MEIDWITQQLKRPGFTQRGLAAAIGIDATAVSKMLAGKRRIQTAEIPKIVSYFKAAPATASGEIAPAFQAARALVSDSAELPVFSSAEGGMQGAMVISSEPTDYVKRPEPLFNVRGAFAVYVINDSMSPAFEHGDMILIHPSKPVRGGDDCLFVRTHPDAGMDALVKRLVRAERERWQVKQYNPAKEFALEKSIWQQAMLVVGKYTRR